MVNETRRRFQIDTWNDDVSYYKPSPSATIAYVVVGCLLKKGQ
jgi:hypothetical protein